MGIFEQQRKSMAIPSGAIPYWRSYERDGCVYSIDKCRLRFPLRWGSLTLSQSGEIIPLTDENVVKAVRGIFFNLGVAYCRGGAGRIGGTLCWWTFGGVIVSLHKFKAFGSNVDCYSIVLEFNPNKHYDIPIIHGLINYLKIAFGIWFCWSSARIDYALDIPYSISDVRLLSRKESSCYLGTYYFGQRGQNGYTRVYDKRKQMREVFRIDIGTEITRIEWESCKGADVCYDVPYVIKDLGKHEVLRFVPMDAWPAALRTFDARTASKIKKSCLEVIPFDPSYFLTLRDALFKHLGLSMDCNIDRLDSKRKDAVMLSESDLEDLDRIQAALRKFAEIKD